MIVSSTSKPGYNIPETSRSAVEGIRDQQERLERNAAEVARPEKRDGLAAGSRERALVEQGEIVRAVRANAKSLGVALQMVGTIIDIKV